MLLTVKSNYCKSDL